MRYCLLVFMIFITSHAWATETMIRQLTEAIEQAPPDAKFQYYQFRARAYSKENMPEGALKDLTTSINLNPTISAYRERADILIELGRYQEAINDLNIILKDDPHDLQMYRLRSSAHFKLKQYGEAMADAQRVLAEKPGDEVSRLIVTNSTNALDALTPVKNIVMNTRHKYVPAIRRSAGKASREPARSVRRTAARTPRVSAKPRRS